MVHTRRATALEQEQLDLAIKLSQADVRVFFKRNKSQAPRLKASKIAKERIKAAEVHDSNRVVKKPSNNGKSTPKRLKLKIKLKFDYRKLEYDKIRRLNIKPTPKAKDFWPYPHRRGIKLGFNSWEHLNWKGPAKQDVERVHKLLADHHKKFEFERYVDMPAHAAKSTVNIDVIIQTIFAQSTGNETAIDTHSRLCNTFPYLVNGKKHVGKIPNWHDVRLLPCEELQTVLEQGGFQNVRAECVQDLLEKTHAINLERKERGIQHFEHVGNPPDATDFVPGMLSIDYLTDQDDNSDEALLGRLLEIRGVGPKSAMCVLAFGFKRPLFVVDTHVLRYCKWLGWVPKQCTDINDAAMFLHNYIPDDIKYDLHNQIWTHCANENVRESKTRTVICAVCGSTPPAKNRDISEFIEHCPLKDLLPPLEERWGARYRRQEPEPELKPTDPEDKDDRMKNDEDKMSELSNLRDILPENESSLSQFLQISTTSFSKSITTSQDDTSFTGEDGKSSIESVASTQRDRHNKPIKAKKLNLKLKSIRFEDIAENQVQEIQDAGYLLWEFRPMDNTFMEAWGKFDQFPRYKWERANIMDRDVAVTYEYAKEVLAGKMKHKWSKIDAEDIAAAQTVSSMAA